MNNLWFIGAIIGGIIVGWKLIKNLISLTKGYGIHISYKTGNKINKIEVIKPPHAYMWFYRIELLIVSIMFLLFESYCILIILMRLKGEYF